MVFMTSNQEIELHTIFLRKIFDGLFHTFYFTVDTTNLIT